MRYFIADHGPAFIRFVVGIVVSAVLVTLSVTVAPQFAPSGMHYVTPILLFGCLAALITACVVITNDDELLIKRIGMAVLATVLSFMIGGVIGTLSGMEVTGSPAYGWFLGIVCAGLAASGGVIGFVFPEKDDMDDLMAGWSVTIHRY